jgi:hypothetical protein
MDFFRGIEQFEIDFEGKKGKFQYFIDQPMEFLDFFLQNHQK